MTYQQEIAKTQLLPFAELYDFVFPEYRLYLTSYPEQIVYDGNTYIPAVMMRNEFQAEKGAKKELIVTFATREEVSLSFLLVNVPRIRFILRRYFISAQKIRTIFVGEGEAVGVEGRTVTFRAVDILALNKCIIPPTVYSSYCNNTLFDNRCGVWSSNHRFLVTVTASSDGLILYGSAFETQPTDYFTYGYIEYKNNYRMITKHDRPNGRVYLHMSFDENVNNKTVIAYAGCDKTPQTCIDKFSNLPNFRGFPYIPLKNPVIWGFQ